MTILNIFGRSNINSGLFNFYAQIINMKIYNYWYIYKMYCFSFQNEILL
jgi:hypothetical protein